VSSRKWRAEADRHVLAEGPYRATIKRPGYTYTWLVDGPRGVLAEGRDNDLASAKREVESFIAAHAARSSQ